MSSLEAINPTSNLESIPSKGVVTKQIVGNFIE